MADYKFPVYGTQGGGLAKMVGDKLVFIEAPDCPSLTVGDEVPEEWDFAPANAIARQESIEQQFGQEEFDTDMY